MNVRKAAFAGSWYPDLPEGCEREIKHFLKRAEDIDIPENSWVGGIVPHAGWFFSGSIACNVIGSLNSEPSPDVFIIFGMHLHPQSSNYIMTEGAWETPFGNLEIETELAGELARRFAFRIETAGNYTQDNTIELQLPFIKYFFPDVKIVPVGVPPSDKSPVIGEAAAETAADLGLKARIVGSTDLTHYGFNYGFLPHGTGASAVEWVRNENDRRVIDAMLAMKPKRVIDEALMNQNACCSGAAAAAIAAGKKMGSLQATQVAYATSYDKSPGDSFVGYVGILF